MNYFSMQRAFYDCVAMAELSAGQIALWQALLNVCNRAGWPVWFFARSEMLAVLSGLSQRGMRNAREQLVGKGFLQVREAGHNRQEYRVCLPQRKTGEAAKTGEQYTPDFAAPPCIPYSQDKTKTRESGEGPAKPVVLTQAKEAEDADRLHSGGRKAEDAGAREGKSAEKVQREAQGEGAREVESVPSGPKKAEEPRAQGAREGQSAEKVQREAQKEGAQGAPGQKAEAGREKANGKSVPEKEQRACAPGADEVTRAAVAYLSQKTGRRFSPTAGCQTLVARRLAEGYREEDFKRVVDVKCAEWKHSEKMAKFLRPETLFGPKFQSYRNQAALRGEKEERDERPLRGVRRI